MSEATEREAADRLRQAVEFGRPCAPVRDLIEAGDVEAAYRVQRHNIDLGLLLGRRIVGRKIGLTSVAVQQQLGVDQPDFGALFADTAYGDGASVAEGAFLQPKVEAEVALVLGADLDLEQPTVADVAMAVALVAPAIEIVDSRVAGWDITIVDTVADNASAGGFVLGGPLHDLRGLDLAAVTVVLRRGEEVVSSGEGRACLGHPLTAAVWLARRMVEFGEPLRAGDIVLTGALGPMCAAVPGDRFVADFRGFGSVAISFEAAAPTE